MFCFLDRAPVCLLHCCSNVKRCGCNEGVAQRSHAPPAHTVMVAHGPKLGKKLQFFLFFKQFSTHLLGSICCIQTFIEPLMFKDSGCYFRRREPRLNSQGMPCLGYHILKTKMIGVNPLILMKEKALLYCFICPVALLL